MRINGVAAAHVVSALLLSGCSGGADAVGPAGASALTGNWVASVKEQDAGLNATSTVT